MSFAVELARVMMRWSEKGGFVIALHATTRPRRDEELFCADGMERDP